MILSKIYNKLSKKNKEDFVLGLVFGLVYGLIFGIIYGLIVELVFGIVYGLIFGIIYGLIVGLVFGIIYGLVFGLVLGLVSCLISDLVVILCNFSQALPFINELMPVLILIGLIFLLVELLFWLSPKEKVKKKDVLSHTIMRKAEALFESLMIFSAVTQIYVLTRDVDFVKYFPEMLRWVGYIGCGIIVIGLVALIGYLFIKLNSLKYSK